MTGHGIVLIGFCQLSDCHREPCFSDCTSDTERPFLVHTTFHCLITVMMKGRYYFMWMLIDSINNTAGLGLRFDERGRPRWDLMTNVHIWDIETSTSVRMMTNAWNVTTSAWLRRLVGGNTVFSRVSAPLLLNAHPRFLDAYGPCVLCVIHVRSNAFSV